MSPAQLLASADDRSVAGDCCLAPDHTEKAGRKTRPGGARISEFVLRMSRRTTALVALSMVAAIGYADYITTWELSLFVFYAVPIFLVAWQGGRRAAILIALLCGGVWFWANSSTHPYATREGYLWATLNRIAYFVIVAYAGTAVRDQRLESAARIAALARARELERELLRAAERERMRIGEDLHDGVCQNLAAIACATECLRTDLEAGRVPAPDQLSLIQKMLTDTVVEARSIARGIFPLELDAAGLPLAIEELVTLTNQLRQTAIVFETEGEIRLPDAPTAMHLYRITQEALSNAMRHSGASRVFVALRRSGDRLLLIVDDDGRGLPTAESGSRSTGIGLRTMRSRAQLIDADFEVTSKATGGVLVRCSIPLPP